MSSRVQHWTIVHCISHSITPEQTYVGNLVAVAYCLIFARYTSKKNYVALQIVDDVNW